MLLNNRHGSVDSDAYRYGFNGKERDDEVKGEGNHYDYGMRIYDPRIAKFVTLDPLGGNFPHYTPYQYAGNKPIKFIDLDGLEEYKHKWDFSYKGLMEFFFGVSEPHQTITNSMTEEGRERNSRNQAQAKKALHFGAKLEEGVYDVMEVGDYVLPVNLVHQLSTGKNLDGTEAAPEEIAFEVLMIIPYGKMFKGGKIIIKHGDEFLEIGNDVRKALTKYNPCGCFTEETVILTNDGTKAISQIEVDDFVLSFDEESNKYSFNRVTNTFFKQRENTLLIKLENGTELRTTSDHPFYVDNKWVLAKDLTSGYTLTSKSIENGLVIISIEQIQEDVFVFNFEVDKVHNYLVTNNEILTHNTSSDCDWIKGFKSFGQFKQFGTQLQAGLKKLDLGDVKMYMQGSSAKGKSMKGVPFGAHSDFDVALTGDKLVAKAKELGLMKVVNSGPIKADSDAAKALGVDKLLNDLKEKMGRDVNVMIFNNVDEVKLKGKSVKIPSNNG